MTTTALSAAVSLAGSVMISNSVLLRAAWSRIATYDRDTEVIRLGGGLQWQKSALLHDGFRAAPEQWLSRCEPPACRHCGNL